MKVAALAVLIALACYGLLVLALGHAYHWWPLRIVLEQAAVITVALIVFGAVVSILFVLLVARL